MSNRTSLSSSSRNRDPKIPQNRGRIRGDNGWIGALQNGHRSEETCWKRLRSDSPLVRTFSNCEMSAPLGDLQSLFHPKSLSNPDGSPLQLPFPIDSSKCLHVEARGHFLLDESTVYCIETLEKYFKRLEFHQELVCRDWICRFLRESASSRILLPESPSKNWVRLLFCSIGISTCWITGWVRDVGKA